MLGRNDAPSAEVPRKINDFWKRVTLRDRTRAELTLHSGGMAQLGGIHRDELTRMRQGRERGTKSKEPDNLGLKQSKLATTT